ncbi:hypothetical protein P8452_50695 [Trifolium repens]|nr:hypothetical protein P8452_50695 [Trifolium repens]
MIGDAAFNMAACKPTNTVYDAKRLIDVNVVAEQHEFEYYRTTLSNVFDPIIVKMINDEGNSMQLGTVVGYAVDKKKNRWTSIFAKYAFQIGFSAATNTFVNTAASVIVEIFKNM